MPYRLCAFYLHEADARGGAFDVDEHRPRGLVLILAALFPGHFSTNDSPTTVELITVYLYMYGVPPRLGWRSRCVCRRRRVPVESRRTNSLLAVRQCVLAGVCVRTLADPPPLAARAPVYPGNHIRIDESRVPGLLSKFAGLRFRRK